MTAPFFTDVLIRVLCLADDFCKEFIPNFEERLLPNQNRKRRRKMRMSMPEIMTVAICYHQSKFRTFKDYYLDLRQKHMSDLPSLVSYSRMIELMGYALVPIYAMFALLQGSETGIYYIDSTPLEVCKPIRGNRSRVFRGIASWGWSIKGRYYGLKANIILNHEGRIVRLWLSPGGTDDRKGVLKQIRGLKGLLCGDKGYISKQLKHQLKQSGITLRTKLRKNMKPEELDPYETYFLARRSIIETAIGLLKSIQNIEHSRHRSVVNFQVNFLAAALAYNLGENASTIQQNYLPGSTVLISN